MKKKLKMKKKLTQVENLEDLILIIYKKIKVKMKKRKKMRKKIKMKKIMMIIMIMKMIMILVEKLEVRQHIIKRRKRDEKKQKNFSEDSNMGMKAKIKTKKM